MAKLVIILLLVLTSVVDQSLSCGEIETPANDFIRNMVSKVRDSFVGQYSKDIAQIDPLCYRLYLVNGYLYEVKAVVTHKNGTENLIHFVIYERLRHEGGAVSLEEILTDVDRKTPLLNG